MNAGDLRSLLDEFATKRVLVIGEAMLDTYASGEVKRICREGPVPVVDVTEVLHLPGGAANAALNVAALGARVTLASVVGDDSGGQALRSLLDRAAVDTSGIDPVAGRTTLTKQRVVANGQLITRVDSGSTTTLSRDEGRGLVERIEAAAASCDVVLVSDYGYGVITPAVVELLRQLSRRLLLVADARDLVRYRGAGVAAAKPNRAEACELLGLGCDTPAAYLKPEVGRLPALLGATVVAATLDRDGVLIALADGSVQEVPARPVSQPQVAGAGDTFSAAFALALSAGASAPVAGELAVAAATVTVRKPRTSACSPAELTSELLGDSTDTQAGVGELAALVQGHRAQGNRIVLTNGCFDIIHAGHVAYLQAAREMGDVLIVGLNSDASVRRLKGPGRPVNSETARASVLRALQCVDHVVVFDEDSPQEVVRTVRPDVYVKGGDYEGKPLPEAALVQQFGGEVRLGPLLKGQSTTAIVERIRSDTGTQPTDAAAAARRRHPARRRSAR